MDQFLFKHKGDGSKGDRCGVDFQEFAKNSNVLSTICAKEQCCVYLARTGSFQPAYINEHINEQAHCVFVDNGDMVVDFIGRSEKINEDWPAVLESINRRSGSSFEVKVVATENQQTGLPKDPVPDSVQNNCSSDEFLNKFDSQTLYDIGHQYASDVVLFGF